MIKCKELIFPFIFDLLDLASEIDGESADYLKNVKNLNPEQRASRLTKINAAFAKSREYGDDKVQLAMQTYEMVSVSHL